MLSPIGEQALDCCIQNGRALLKFLSTNDVKRPESHQCGPLLPKEGRELFSPHPPVRGENKDSHPSILWWDGIKTASRVVWYGASKREYRLTGFQRGFPHLTTLDIGSLFVLVPTSDRHDSFEAFIVDLDDDIDQLFEALGVEVVHPWGGVYRSSAEVTLESEGDCVAISLRKFATQQNEFPDTATMSKVTMDIVERCYSDFANWKADKQLLELHQREYELFRLIEQVIFGSEVRDRVFATVDDFLSAARPLQNRRMSRAGRALENHVGTLLHRAGIPFDARSAIKGHPDVVIPSSDAYSDDKFPVDKLFVMGIKTSCRERWRQVVEEAPRVKRKFLLTLQQGVSANQIAQMTEAGITQVVPKPFHKSFPKCSRSSLLTVHDFLALVQQNL